MIQSLSDLFLDHTFQVVALGTAFLGLLSGVVGTLATLKQESLLGDVLSHSALPGIGIAFILLSKKNLIIMLIGAALAGGLATVLINWMKKKSIIKGDSAMSLILSSFFGLGLVLMTYIQRQPNGHQAGLENFIYGQASAMLMRDIKLSVVIASVFLIILVLFWKEIKVFIFDPTFAHTMGFSAVFLNGLVSLMIVVTIVIGLESVGVVLMSSLLIAPSIAARQWSDRMGVVAVLAGIFGFLSGLIGSFISSIGARIPTGPTIVLVASLFVLVSLLVAPKRGLLARFFNQRKHKNKLLEAAKALENGEGGAI
ncbi:metal ABC transporter permease [Jeotgalibaca arthritidis]|uniref:Manganese import system permease protein ScaB n=1 Tax=Jeotgalibaca arthritidis TaxID=1868794 RepID=A0A6G7K9I7_9LACT|nr:metal ABC transporter permease [Jeotgalibaca arthritidis]QII81915.1 metal ABC transporter permease [Jeotgalibaca arthritidis]